MKKLILSIIAIAVSVCMASAQDMATATETAKTANEALTSNDYTTALKGFKEAMTLAEACGEDGAEIVSTCKDIIPRIMLAIAKDAINDNKLDEALKGIAEAVKVAEEYKVDDVLDEAADLVPQIKMKKANDLYKAQDFAGAVEAFKDILADDPANGKVALTLGACYAKLGDNDSAEAAFTQALENGQVVAAKKQLANISLKKASAALKAKKYAEAVESALKSNEYVEDAKCLQIAGQASQLAGKEVDAIKYFESYLEAAPESKNAGQIAFTLGALYQKAKNNAKAKEFYTKALTDPKFGAEAKKQIDALK